MKAVATANFLREQLDGLDIISSRYADCEEHGDYNQLAKIGENREIALENVSVTATVLLDLLEGEDRIASAMWRLFRWFASAQNATAAAKSSTTTAAIKEWTRRAKQLATPSSNPAGAGSIPSNTAKTSSGSGVRDV